MVPFEVFPAGSLAVVAVPLGNPQDVTLRALEILRAADVVAAEDTRTVRRMLGRYGIAAQLLSYHDWNEAGRARTLFDRMASGDRIALVSEAGTPGISDPGFDLVRLARRNGLRVFPVPGASAVTAFLSASGLPTNAFSFQGFPPSQRPRRRAAFRKLEDRPETLVFYESPRRILAALADGLEIFGDRECSLAREMTKPHEEFLFGAVSQVLDVLGSRASVRGEICWGVRGADPGLREKGISVEEAISAAIDAGLSCRQAAREVAQRCGVKAKDAYAALLAQRNRREP
jgi:16S rRNA (cytidine1402-2'-O)-methyltransferase